MLFFSNYTGLHALLQHVSFIPVHGSYNLFFHLMLPVCLIASACKLTIFMMLFVCFSQTWLVWLLFIIIQRVSLIFAAFVSYFLYSM